MKRVWRWIIAPFDDNARWWYRKDRSRFDRAMDFYCDRIYPALMALGIAAIIVIQLLAAHYSK